MPDRWVPSTQGEEELLYDLATGFDDWASLVVKRIQQVERGIERYHFHSRKKPRTVRYADTITHATYLNGQLIGGTNVRGAARPKGDSIHARVYTASFLGHMLELTGAARHDIPIPIAPGITIVVDHPGFKARPHFVPGLLMSVSEVGATMRVKINARQSAPGSHPAPRTFVGNE